MVSRIFAMLCVAMVWCSVSAQDAHVKSAVSCLNEWWSTNKDSLLEYPEHQPLKEIMDIMSVEWLSDPWAQMAIHSGMGNIEKTPETKNIGTEGFKCIECIRQLAIPPEHCKRRKQ